MPETETQYIVRKPLKNSELRWCTFCKGYYKRVVEIFFNYHYKIQLKLQCLNCNDVTYNTYIIETTDTNATHSPSKEFKRFVEVIK